MKEIYTRIIIDAPLEKVWGVFTNFIDYPNWNPFIISIEGQVELNNRIKVTLAPPNSNKMTFRPKILVYSEKSELQWLGSFIIPGLFDGKHIFKIIDNKDGTVTFIQKELFNGFLVPLFSKMLGDNTKSGFISMNEKLKEICEKNN